MKNAGKRILVFALLFLMAAGQVFAFDGNTETSHVYSWIANDFNGYGRQFEDGTQVLHDIATIYVTPDGTVYTNTEWEENGHNFTEIKDGVQTNIGFGSHGWGYEGGLAVAANDKYVFFGQSANNEGGGLYDRYPNNYPPKGVGWQGIQRRLREDITQGANFEGGVGKHGAPATQTASYKVLFEEGSTYSKITSLACDNRRLYAAACQENKIFVLDAESMTQLDVWNVESPQTIALDKNNVLWVNQTSTNKILSFNATSGKQLSGEIVFEEGTRPWAMCVDKNNQLYISDLGPNEWILVYNNLDATPTLSHTLGEKGGVYSGVAGEIKDWKFYHISGLGVDDNNNLVVANAGIYHHRENAVLHTGATYIECYNLDSREKQWELRGTSFVDTATLDPKDETIVYYNENQYRLDYSKSPGKEWQYEAFTLNPHKYPDDPRIGMTNTVKKVLYVQDQKILLTTDMDGASLAIFRFDETTDGMIAIPAGAFFSENNKGKQWTDNNGDGQMDEDEITNAGLVTDLGRDYLMLDNGMLIKGCDSGNIYELPFRGFNKYGVPIWEGEKPEITNIQEDFSGMQVKRMWYDKESDLMFVGLQDPSINVLWRTIGNRVACYENWFNKNARKLRYTINVPYGDPLGHSLGGGSNDYATGMSVAGEYLFIGYTEKPQIYILKKDTGELYDIIERPIEVTPVEVWIDTTASYQAFQLANGEYIIFVEDDVMTKNWMIRWRDKGGVHNFNEGKKLAVARDKRQLVFPDQEPLIIDGRTMVPMRYIFETLGATVTWDQASRSVTGSNGTHTVMLTIDQQTALIDGAPLELDVPAQIVNDRTMVPLRVVAEGLGVEVEWHPEEQMVNIVTPRETLKALGETTVE